MPAIEGEVRAARTRAPGLHGSCPPRPFRQGLRVAPDDPSAIAAGVVRDALRHPKVVNVASAEAYRHEGPPTACKLKADECLMLLTSVPVGRVGLSIDALPVVVPVNFAVVDGEIVFRTTAGTKFHAATTGAVLAFEADQYGPSDSTGWTVLVQGVAAPVTDPNDIARLSALDIDPWAVDGPGDRFVRICAAKISGRRFVRSPTP